MKPLLTKVGRLLNEQSRNRETVIRLNKLDEMTEEQRAEFTAATDRLEAIEPEIRSAMTAESAERAELEAEAARGPRFDSGMDAETRERNDLARRASLSRFVAAALAGRAVTGVEAELRAAFPQCEDGDIPLDLLEVPHRDAAHAETRAITPGPEAGQGVNLDSVQPYVFAMSLAPRLGIQIRDVPSGTFAVPRISTVPAGGAAPVAKGDAADSTAGAITVATATPKRLPARLSVAVEDVAAFGNDSFESGLRQALQGQLGHVFDTQILSGDGQGANLSGLLQQLTDPDAPANGVEDFDRWAKIAAGAIDGIWAQRLSDVFMVFHHAAYVQAEGVFRGTDGEVSAANYLERRCAGFVGHSRMPAAANNIAQGVAARLGQPGLMRAVIPSWGRLTVDDIYSNAAEGQRHFTISAIVGNLVLVQPDAFKQIAARISA